MDFYAVIIPAYDEVKGTGRSKEEAIKDAIENAPYAEKHLIRDRIVDECDADPTDMIIMRCTEKLHTGFQAGTLDEVTIWDGLAATTD